MPNEGNAGMSKKAGEEWKKAAASAVVPSNVVSLPPVSYQKHSVGDLCKVGRAVASREAAEIRNMAMTMLINNGNNDARGQNSQSAVTALASYVDSHPITMNQAGMAAANNSTMQAPTSIPNNNPNLGVAFKNQWGSIPSCTVTPVAGDHSPSPVVFAVVNDKTPPLGIDGASPPVTTIKPPPPNAEDWKSAYLAAVTKSKAFIQSRQASNACYCMGYGGSSQASNACCMMGCGGSSQTASSRNTRPASSLNREENHATTAKQPPLKKRMH